MRDDLTCKLSSYRAMSKNDAAMIRPIPQLGSDQKTNQTPHAYKSKKKENREVKQNKSGIEVLGEEGEGQHDHHQKRNGYNELRKNSGKMPAPFEAVEVHFKV